ncbi:MAG: phosphomethylpyrimidine synthase ThiC [Dehalococcoidia bacterium]|nr:phosphomethylpyrimidine synthase ThiC [Dehalococcoidia bacterium]
MTLIERAKTGSSTPEIDIVARAEGVPAEQVASGVIDGTIVIPANPLHTCLEPRGVGKGLRTKVNANIGTSSDSCDVDAELRKMRVAILSGADAMMDLSTGGDITATRRTLISECTVPFGTVPIYQAGIQAIETRGAIVDLTVEDLFDAVESHARDGVDFMTIHCGVTQSTIERLRMQGRVTNIVSRGGAFLTAWMLHNEQENPFFEYYDRLLEMARKYDFALSLGDGLRPGCTADASDRAQFQELILLGELVQRAREGNVQVFVEGPGHVPIDQIVANVQMEKTICQGAPFYVLGPLVTDIGAGYDHITGAIGGAIAASAGADFLCYVTPSEHLGLPDEDDVRDGVIASMIAAHAADMAKGVRGAAAWDRKMSQARKSLDWTTQAELALVPDLARKRHLKTPTQDQACSMCGKYCAMEIVEKYLGVSPAVRPNRPSL